MRLFGLEIKRILKSRRTLILLSAAMLLSVLMAYLPISFEGINRPNEDGTVTELDGLAAIEYKRDLYAATHGEVTAEKVKQALITYQSCVNQYGPVEEDEFPLEVYIEKIVPILPLLMVFRKHLLTRQQVLVLIGWTLTLTRLNSTIMKSVQNISTM